MKHEVMEAFALRPGMRVLDCTLGNAGHALEICKSISPNGVLFACDWDEAMLEIARARLSAANIRLELRHCDYRDAATVFAGEKFDGILLDLGLNSMQLDDPSRGISFSKDGPLDMRFDRTRGEPAAAFLNRASQSEIEQVIKDYGDENWARKISQIIVDRRKERSLKTTSDLVDCVLAAIPPSKREKRIHPATRTFQAVRIYINRELEGLQECFESLAQMLSNNGNMVILSYQSGEDRAAKRAARELSKSGSFIEVTKKPVTPSAQEIVANPRSRSAKMRIIRAKAS